MALFCTIFCLLELDKETCWHRRHNRIGYFEGLAWPYYLHNLSLLRGFESQIHYMNGSDSMEANFCQILNTICQRMVGPPPNNEIIRDKCNTTG